jgi:hypothetical protein
MPPKVINADGSVTYSHIKRTMRRDGTYHVGICHSHYVPKTNPRTTKCRDRNVLHAKRLRLKRIIQTIDDVDRIDHLTDLLANITVLDQTSKVNADIPSVKQKNIDI